MFHYISCYIRILAIQTVVIFFITPCYAGINFAMTSGRKPIKVIIIPDFNSPQEAIRFIHKIGPSERLRRALNRHMHWYMDAMHLPSYPIPTLRQISNSKYYANQFELIKIAISTLENLIKLEGKIDDAAMYIPQAFVSRKDAVWWARGQHEGLLEIKQELIKKIRQQTKEVLIHKDFRSGLAYAQVERLYAALEIIDSKMNKVGANFIAYSCPVLLCPKF